MFLSYQISNFKTHKESDLFALNGVTILTGTNNSGKSSIIQSLRLLSLIKEHSGPGFTRLPFEKVFGLKSFTNTLNKIVQPTEAITFDFDCDIAGLDFCNIVLEFDSTASHEYTEIKAKNEAILRLMRISFKKEGNESKWITFSLVEDSQDLYYKVDGYIKDKFIQFNGLVPHFSFYEPQNSGQVYGDISSDKELMDIFKFISSISPKTIKYLNANRNIEKVLLAASTDYMEEHGENAANIMYTLRDQKMPGEEKTFKELFDEWTKKILNASFDIRLEGSAPKIITYENTHEFDLDQIGFGNTQILPLIIMVLSSTKGDLLLIETPEGQLHPKWRANLAEFFYFAAKKGLKLIIETHSLELINRMRLLVKGDNSLADLTSLYFLRKNELESTIEEISIEETGRLSSWPDDFLDKVTVEDSFKLLRP